MKWTDVCIDRCGGRLVSEGITGENTTGILICPQELDGTGVLRSFPPEWCPYIAELTVLNDKDSPLFVRSRFVFKVPKTIKFPRFKDGIEFPPIFPNSKDAIGD